MKVRKKITIIMVPILLLAVVLVYMTFEMFFESYLKTQEKREVELIVDSISSYIIEKENEYLGSVNDWGHWDDTYLFMSNHAPEYINDELSSQVRHFV